MNRLLIFSAALLALITLCNCNRLGNEPQKNYTFDNSILITDSLQTSMMQLTAAHEKIMLQPDSVVMYRLVNKNNTTAMKREAPLDNEFSSVFSYYLLSGSILLSPVSQVTNSNYGSTSVVYYKAGKTIAINFTSTLDTVSFSADKTTTFLLSDNQPFKKLLKVLNQYEN